MSFCWSKARSRARRQSAAPADPRAARETGLGSADRAAAKTITGVDQQVLSNLASFKKDSREKCRGLKLYVCLKAREKSDEEANPTSSAIFVNVALGPYCIRKTACSSRSRRTNACNGSPTIDRKMRWKWNGEKWPPRQLGNRQRLRQVVLDVVDDPMTRR